MWTKKRLIFKGSYDYDKPGRPFVLTSLRSGRKREFASWQDALKAGYRKIS